MNLRIPRGGAIWAAVVMVAAAVLFVYLMGRFGGPAVSLGGPAYEVRAVVPDVQGLARKSDVLVRGVKVGEVDRIAPAGSRSRVTFTVRDRYAPIPSGATVRIGQKTLLGEAYVDLDLGRGGPPLADRATLPARQVLASVELDEALAAFGERAQRDIRALSATAARGAAAPQTAERVSRTLGRLDALTAELRGLGELLDGQERGIAGVVVDGRRTFEALGAHEQQIARLVGSARRTLAATSASRAGLDAGLRELPRLLTTADRTLRTARPLLGEARPLAAGLRRLGPELQPALDALGPAAEDAARVLAGLPALTRAAGPVLDDAEPALRAASPAARRLDPALANVVPALRYLSARRDTMAAWFANTAGIGARSDAKGHYVRFNIFVEPGTGFGTPGSFSSNSYTGPGDAARNAPYEPGSYPRLLPYRP